MNLFNSFRAAINPTLNARHPSPARLSHQDSWRRASSMIANDSPRKLNRAVAMAVVLVCMAVAPVLAGEMKWTGGANDGKWENKDNWDPKGPPTENDDVVIPKNSKTITTDGTEKKVNSLKVEDSDPALEPQFPRTKITADGSGKSVKITAKGDKGISIGENDEVHGADGKDGKADPRRQRHRRRRRCASRRP